MVPLRTSSDSWLLRPRSDPGPTRPGADRLLSLLEAYCCDPHSLPPQTAIEIQGNLDRIALQLGLEQPSLKEARFVDHDTICVVLSEPGDRPAHADLLMDGEWNLAGGILFAGLSVAPIRLA